MTDDLTFITLVAYLAVGFAIYGFCHWRRVRR